MNERRSEHIIQVQLMSSSSYQSKHGTLTTDVMISLNVYKWFRFISPHAVNKECEGWLQWKENTSGNLNVYNHLTLQDSNSWLPSGLWFYISLLYFNVIIAQPPSLLLNTFTLLLLPWKPFLWGSKGIIHSLLRALTRLWAFCLPSLLASVLNHNWLG